MSSAGWWIGAAKGTVIIYWTVYSDSTQENDPKTGRRKNGDFVPSRISHPRSRILQQQKENGKKLLSFSFVAVNFTKFKSFFFLNRYRKRFESGDKFLLFLTQNRLLSSHNYMGWNPGSGKLIPLIPDLATVSGFGSATLIKSVL